MFQNATGVAVLFFLSILAPVASADGVKWTLNDLTFSGGGTATGSFVFDATTNTIRSIDIVTGPGVTFAAKTFPGATYTALDPGYNQGASAMAFVTVPFLLDYTGTSVIELEFFDPSHPTVAENLTNLGGTVLASINEFTCTNPNCSAATELRDTFDGGTAFGTATAPEPSTALLLGLALLGLIAIGQRKE